MAENKNNAVATSNGNKVRAKSTRLLDRYESEIKKALMEKYNYSSVMQIPHLDKVVINIGVGEATADKKQLEEAVKELAIITGQKPVTTKAKKSIATFKLREGQEIGCKVTLRGVRMYEFIDKLVSSHFHVFVTSVAFQKMLSMVMVTTHSVLKNN